MITKWLRALRGERDVLTQTGRWPVRRSSHTGSHLMLAVMLGGRDYGPILQLGQPSHRASDLY